MSASRRIDVRLAPRARRDYERIVLSSQRLWGDDQSLAYRDAIARAINLLAEYPEIGRRRDDLVSGCRSTNVEHHVIFYHRPRPSEVVVLRILHRRQDPTGKIATQGA